MTANKNQPRRALVGGPARAPQRLLADKPRVALKLMRNAAQHRQEVEVRQGRALDGRFVVCLPEPPRHGACLDRFG